jgi:hypothetical protein
MYQLCEGLRNIKRLSDGLIISFDPDNTDYQTLLSNLIEGVELKDVDGRIMSKTEVKFIYDILV